MIIADKIYIIHSTSEVFGKIVQHAAIAFEHDDKMYCIHRTFEGIELLPLDTFLKTRQLLHSEELPLKYKADTNSILIANRIDQFELINNNCENFVNDFINTYTDYKTPRVSKQVVFWGMIAIIALIIAYINYKKK